MKILNITSMDNDRTRFAYELDIGREWGRSVYAEGMYGNIYRVDKVTGTVYMDGIKVAETSTFEIFEML